MIYVFFVVYVILPDTVMFTIYYVHLKYVARILSYMPADNTVNFSLLSSANLNLMPGDCFDAELLSLDVLKWADFIKHVML